MNECGKNRVRRCGSSLYDISAIWTKDRGVCKQIYWAQEMSGGKLRLKRVHISHCTGIVRSESNIAAPEGHTKILEQSIVWFLSTCTCRENGEGKDSPPSYIERSSVFSSTGKAAFRLVRIKHYHASSDHGDCLRKIFHETGQLHQKR